MSHEKELKRLADEDFNHSIPNQTSVSGDIKPKSDLVLVNGDVSEPDYMSDLVLVNGDVSEPEADYMSEWHCHSSTVNNPPNQMARNQLIVVSVLCFLFMVGETVGGVLSNSLALFTDVLHLASDLISFVISLIAIHLAKKSATEKMSFGYYRTEVVGALISVFFIWAVTGVLMYIAVERILEEHYKEVKPKEMLITATLGVIFNIVMAIVLQSDLCFSRSASRPMFGHGHGHSHASYGSHDNHGDKNGTQKKPPKPNKNGYEPFPSEKDNLQLSSGNVDEASQTEAADDTKKPRFKNINVRAAFIHVLGDILQSLGVLLASLIILLKPDDKYKLADPICTFLFSILVLFTTVNVMRDTMRIILEGVPKDVSYCELRKRLQTIPGVAAVHSLTIWCLTLDKNALSVHLAIDDAASHQRVLTEASQMLKEHYNFLNTTIQVEYYRPAIMTSCTSCQDLKN